MIHQPSIEDAAGANPAAWIGRREYCEGRLSAELAAMLAAALGHPAAAALDLAPGAAMPWLWHWGAFPEFVAMDRLGEDGHPRTGGFLPPLPYPRRMWAGGALSFEGALAVGEPLVRRSEIVSVEEKAGASGSMVFVGVSHAIEGGHGRVEERQDIVYLDIPDRFRPPKRVSVPDAALFDETVAMTEARLFRFSAATFNAHRIHYDLPYAREVEKYPALVVHGPMQAMMLMEAGVRHTGRAPTRFRFRGVHPMFHDEALRLIGTRGAAEGAIDLCTAAASGHQGLQARMEWTP
ncbi:MAG: MaoC family dehydratase N-terminal domain-containing protein [Paracoccaceae bacterium]